MSHENEHITAYMQTYFARTYDRFVRTPPSMTFSCFSFVCWRLTVGVPFNRQMNAQQYLYPSSNELTTKSKSI